MAEDLEFFRNTVKRVYQTMAQDVSDVSANKQAQLLGIYQSKNTACVEKTIRAIDKIFEYVPNFDFEEYYSNPNYLKEMFPLPKAASEDPEEIEAHKRQEAYHRLKWLRSERHRLARENRGLETYLKAIKKQMQLEQLYPRRSEYSRKKRKAELNATREQLYNRLQDINDNLERKLAKSESELDYIASKSSLKDLPNNSQKADLNSIEKELIRTKFFKRQTM